MPTHHKGSPREIRALDTFIKLSRSVESLQKRFVREKTMGGLSHSQFAVLECLHHLGPLAQHEIGSKLLRSTGNITLVIDNLEKLELVRRDRNPLNRRSIIVSLTGKGKRMIATVFPRHLEAIVRALGCLTAGEQEQLAGLCRKLGRAQQQK